ncbi:MAG: hypothetical protein HGB19_00695 [Chlorobiales bacterium]|nr:hypothetical protein [Chlorobiales bacterium]
MRDVAQNPDRGFAIRRKFVKFFGYGYVVSLVSICAPEALSYFPLRVLCQTRKLRTIFR